MKEKSDLIKHFLKFPISGKSRTFVKEYLKNRSIQNIRLIMTLVVRNEEEIIEKHIRFHSAMGVDGVIVIDHLSCDRTNEILNKLKQEGLVLEIIKKTTPDHKHHYWVNEMIKIAKNKYKADWVINADADEFYYSKDLNLKKSIWEYKNSGINALVTDSVFSYPVDEENFLNNKYFITSPLQDFEKEQSDIKNDEIFFKFSNKNLFCPKVIHATKGFKSVVNGNHGIIMHNKKQVPCSNIVLYHYSIRNYKGYEEKILRWINSVDLAGKGYCEEIKEMVKIYKNNKLREDYDKYYNKEVREVLTESGVVSVSTSVQNFLKLKKIDRSIL